MHPPQACYAIDELEESNHKVRTSVEPICFKYALAYHAALLHK